MTTAEIRLSGACNSIVTRNIEYFYNYPDYFKSLKLKVLSDTFSKHMFFLGTWHGNFSNFRRG